MSASGLVTILFTDLVGSTDLASRVGDVAADEVRRHHFDDLRGAIVQTGGSEVKTIGDAMMVSYSSAADALTGAVAMQCSVERRNRQADGPALAMRVGVSAGDATFEDDDWFGTPVIEASRLCAAADGRQILVSDLVRALAGSRSSAELTSIGTRELKGLPEPLAICEVAWVLDEASDVTALPLPGFVETLPAFAFAGRVVERERLVTAWKEAADGTRRVVLVSGEPGVGKTRLVTELVKTAHEQGALLLWGRCAEELDVPYQPFAEALRHYVHLVPADRLRAELGPLGGELTRIVPDLEHLVPGLAEPVRTEAETERHRLFEAVCDLLEAISLRTPIVLVLDDVHWADKPSLLLLRHILRRLTSVPLLILATYRDTDLDRGHPLSEVLADLRREPGAERLDLQGLDPGEVTDFMERAAGHGLEESGLALAEAVHRETQGNPFFLGEMLLHLAESGVIVQREGRWVSDFTLGEVGIPEGIREVVGRRVSRLSDTANTALSVAAVVGPEFDADLVAALSELPSDDVFDALDEAVRASLLREVKGRFGRYAFAHALVRSTLYEELSTNRRVRMHWRVGQAIEASRPDDLDALAHHYSEGALAGDPRKAVDIGRRAAARAFADLAFEAAARHLDKVFGSLELISAPDPELRFELLMELGQVLRAADDPRRREVGFAAVEAARALGEPARFAEAAASMTGVVNTLAGDVDKELVAVLREALAAIDAGPSPLRARLLCGLGIELFWGPDNAESRRLATEAQAMARETGDPSALKATLLGSWSRVDGSAPILDDARAAYEEAAAQAWGDPVADYHVHRSLAYISGASGDAEAMHLHFAASYAVAEQLRQPRLIFIARSDRALVKAFTGDLAGAEQELVDAMTDALTQGVSDGVVMSHVGAVFYMIRRGQGRIDELIPAVEDLVRTQPGAPVWRVALAGTLSESDREEDAAPHTQYLAANGCANVPTDVEYPVTLCGLARLSRKVPVEEADLRYVYEHLLPFAGVFNWSGTSITDSNDHGLGAAAARLGDFAASDAHFTAAVQLCERTGARPYLAEAHYDWACLLAERGELTAAEEHARASLAVAEEIGGDGPFGLVASCRKLLAELEQVSRQSR